MRRCPSPGKLEKLPSNARRQRRLSKVSFRIYNEESYRQDTNSSWRFEDEMEVRSSDNKTDVFCCKSQPRKADTDLILHCHHIRCRTATVLATYADILLLLYIRLVSLQPHPVDDMRDLEKEKVSSITALRFHTLTGCGTTSFFPPQPFEDVGIEGFLSEV